MIIIYNKNDLVTGADPEAPCVDAFKGSLLPVRLADVVMYQAPSGRTLILKNRCDSRPERVPEPTVADWDEQTKDI